MPSKPFDYFDQHEYEHGFCECYKNPLICVVGWFFPCCLVGKIAADLEGQGNSFDCVSCLCMHLGIYRNRKLVQTRDNIHETDQGSILASSICGLCAMCQDAHQAGVRQNQQQSSVPQIEAPAAVSPPQ
jgi:Cys-rich protein (TIGR01571 family)